MSEEKKLGLSIEATTRGVTKAAMQVAYDKLSQHFDHDGQKWVINRDNIPTIDDSYQIAKDVLGLKLGFEYMDNESSWMLGNLISEVKKIYGEDFDLESLESITHRSNVTLRTAESVYTAFAGCRVPGISYTHHKEVYFVRGLSDRQKLMCLHKAREMSLTTSQTRALAKYVSREGDDILTSGDTQLALMNKLEDKKKSEPIFILVDYTGRVRRVKEHSFTKELEKGSRVIIQISPDLELLRLAK